MNNYNEFINIGKFKNEDWFISTIKPKYSNIYETAIMLNGLDKWNIVEEYISEEKALEGHKKYCNMNENTLNNLTYIR